MSGGILLAVAGVWVVCQILGGDALARLGIAGEAELTGHPGQSVGQAVGGAGQAAVDQAASKLPTEHAAR